MADKNFGLPESLINAVKQVSENSASLPRDERERDLARQVQPKKLDEALIGKQKKLDKNKNGKLDKQDFEMLRKEEAELEEAKKKIMKKNNSEKEEKNEKGEKEEVEEAVYTPDTHRTDSLIRTNKAFVKSVPPTKKRKPLPGERGLKFDKMKEEVEQVDEAHTVGYVPVEDREKFMGHMHKAGFQTTFRSDEPAKDYEASANPNHGARPIEGKKHAVVSSDNPDAIAHAKKFPGFVHKNDVKEETDLDEARRTPEQEARAKKMAKLRASKSKAAQAAKAAAKQHKEPDAEKKEPKKVQRAENETPNDDTRDPRENIINQLRKQPVEGKHTITFRNGKTHLLSPAIVNKARTLHANMHPRDKGDFQERLAASLESFQDAIKNPDNVEQKPKGKFALGGLRPDFAKRLSDMAAAHAARQKAKKKD